MNTQKNQGDDSDLLKGRKKKKSHLASSRSKMTDIGNEWEIRKNRKTQRNFWWYKLQISNCAEKKCTAMKG